MPWWAVVGGNAAFWPAWTFAAGYLAHRTAASRFAIDDTITAERGFERGGRWYQQTWRIEAWKGLLPEAGALYAGGFAKRAVDGRDIDHLELFVAETRRAEHAHWRMAAGVFLTPLWNPWWALPINLAFAAGTNAPCIAVQRYNRARLRRLVRRLTEPTTSA